MAEREHAVRGAHDPKEAPFDEQPPLVVADRIQTLPGGHDIGRRARKRVGGLRRHVTQVKIFLAVAVTAATAGYDDKETFVNQIQGEIARPSADETKRVWERPEVSEIKAGAAEGGDNTAGDNNSLS